MAVDCRGASFSYEEAQAPIAALKDVTFELAPGRALALLGASGAGKSTLLQVLRGLDPPEEGAVLLDGREASGADARRLFAGIGLVFQLPELQLFATTARDDVAFGPRRHGLPEAEAVAAAEAAMARVGLPPDEFGARHPFTLSGGEQRRLALAGVLAMRPRLLLLDEPFVSLDPATRHELSAILAALKGDGVTLVIATHDIDIAWALCDEVLILREGRVAAAGAWDFADHGRVLTENRLQEPFLVQLWRLLGRDPEAAPRTIRDAAEALA